MSGSSENRDFADKRAFAAAEDRHDPLAAFRQAFNFPRERGGYEPVYLCGNSLGLQPKSARSLVIEELEVWAALAVDAHFHSERPWWRYHESCTAGFCALTGAAPEEVTAMNTLTVNLHLLMAGFYRPTPTRYRIVVEAGAFPSDRYAAVSQLRRHGFGPGDGLLEWPPRSDGRFATADLAALLERHGESVALLLLPGVQYLNGQVLDMCAICELGRRHGAKVGLDLAHAIGNVELRLDEWSPDFASWCTYKYLNAGPGAVAGAFVARRHLGADTGQLQGWWGNRPETRFRMAREFDPAPGADAWQLSNPPILSLAPVIASLELFRKAGIGRLRAKSRRLTDYLEWLIARRFGDDLRVLTPPDTRGAQLSFVVRAEGIEPRAVFDKLVEYNVTGDWREPNVIRVAPAPLYNSFTDVYEFAERLDAVFAALRGSP